MPYRPLEYVPEVYQPNDSRITQLMLLQNQNEADRIRQSGMNRALMLRGIGETASGMMSSLAQYRREAPMRAEQERQRREADKLRGLDQFAGAGGLDETARGELYRREGFASQGQELIDRDVKRKADRATLDREEKMRLAAERAEVADALARIEASDDPEQTYLSTRAQLQAKLSKKEDADKLPETWNPTEVKAFRIAADSYANVIARQNAAAAAFNFDIAKENYLEGRVKRTQDFYGPLVELADTKEEWDRMVSGIDSYLEKLPEKERDAIWQKLQIDREFSQEGYERAKKIHQGPEKMPGNFWELEMQRSKKTTGHYPQTDEEVEALRRRTMQPTPAQSLAIKKEANALRQKFSDRVEFLQKEFGSDPDNPTYRKLFEQYHDDLEKGLAALGETVDGGAVQDGRTGGAGGAGGTGGAAGGRVQMMGRTPSGDYIVKGPSGNLMTVTPEQFAEFQRLTGGGQRTGEAGGQVTSPSRGSLLARPGDASRSYSGGASRSYGGGASRSLSEAADEYVPPVASRGTGWRPPSPAPRREDIELPSPPASMAPGAPMNAPPSASASPLGPGQVRVTNGTTVGVAHQDELPALAERGWQLVGGRGSALPPGQTLEGSVALSEQPADEARMSPPPGALSDLSRPIQTRASGGRETPTQVRPPDKPMESGLTPEEVIRQTSPKVSEATTMQERLDLLKTMMFMAGYEIEPVSTVRTAKQQAELFARGRSVPGSVVTEKSGALGDESRHQQGRAVDFAFIRDGKRLPQNMKGLPWHLLGMAAEKVGLTWGGRWQSLPDRPHVELPDVVGPADPRADATYRQPLGH